jgi:hypothetical protein
MSYLYCSSLGGCVGGSGFSRYLASFDDIPESEFYDDVDDSMLLVPDFPFDDMEVY